MKIMAILVDEFPKDPESCPFCYGTNYDADCCMGGRCQLRWSKRCDRLTAPFVPGESYDEED